MRGLAENASFPGIHVTYVARIRGSGLCKVKAIKAQDAAEVGRCRNRGAGFLHER